MFDGNILFQTNERTCKTHLLLDGEIFSFQWKESVYKVGKGEDRKHYTAFVYLYQMQ